MKANWIYPISYLLSFFQFLICAYILHRTVIYHKKLRPYLIFSILAFLSSLQNIILSIVFPIERIFFLKQTTIISLGTLDYKTTNEIIIHIYSMVEFIGLSLFLLNQIKLDKKLLRNVGLFFTPIISLLLLAEIVNPNYRFVKILIEPFFLISLSSVAIVDIVYENRDMIGLKETHFSFVSSIMFLYSANLPNSLILKLTQDAYGKMALYYSLTNTFIYIIFYLTIANAYKWKTQAIS
jgi:hypothetical protein